MRYLLIILLITSCSSQTHTDDCIVEYRDPDSLETRISTDSLLILADQIKERYAKGKSQQLVNMDSLKNLLSTEVNLYDASQQEYQESELHYQEQLSINKDLMKPTTRRIYKDTIIYIPTFIDTIIYRKDTITITDTIWKTIKWRKRRH